MSQPPHNPSTDHRLDPEAGTVTVFAVLITTVVLMMAGLAVDVSGHIHAMQEARSVAREAARAGAQQVQVAPALRGIHAVTDAGQAVGAANSYLAAAGVNGSAAATSPTTIRVEVTTTYSTRFLSVVGVNSLQASGHAQARITRTLEGVEQ